jgi:hypothetical protein
VWTADLQVVGETFAHEYGMYDMTGGSGSQFYTSCSDCVIHQWELNPKDGSIVLLDMLRGHQEPPSRLRYVGNRLYSGDSTGQVNFHVKYDSRKVCNYISEICGRCTCGKMESV